MTEDEVEKAKPVLQRAVGEAVSGLLRLGLDPETSSEALLSAALGACLGSGMSIEQIQATIQRHLSDPRMAEAEAIIQRHGVTRSACDEAAALWKTRKVDA